MQLLFLKEQGNLTNIGYEENKIDIYETLRKK